MILLKMQKFNDILKKNLIQFSNYHNQCKSHLYITYIYKENS